MNARTYQVASCLGALCVANGFRPFERRGGIASAAAFGAGWITTETPLVGLGAHIGLGAVAARRGLLRSGPGRAGALLGAASVVGLAGLYHQSRGAAAVLEQALVDGLGAGYRSRMVAPPSARAFSSAPSRGASTGSAAPSRLLALRRHYTATADRQLSYGTDGPKNVLDVWRRPDLPGDGSAPVLIQLHGGAWTTGDNQTQALPLLARLAERGWVCVVPRYRLSPKAVWPAQIVDVMAVIAWTKANIVRWGGDPGFVALTGGSAGAHLSALAALASDAVEFKPGIEDADTAVQAVVAMYGAYDWTDRDATANPYTQKFVLEKVIQQPLGDAGAALDRGSPRSWVGPQAPPFFVAHGVNDAMLPVEQARSFVAALRAVSNAPVVSVELPFAQHAFDMVRSPRTRATVEAIERFLEVTYGEHLGGSPQPRDPVFEP